MMLEYFGMNADVVFNQVGGGLNCLLNVELE
jgi:hypothetical protein